MKDLADTDVYWWRPLEDDPAEPDTRERILQAAYREIHMNGFQAASLSNILKHTGVTKGALYHHFPNKTELGYAVIDEVIARHIHKGFIEPIQKFERPIDGFIDMMMNAGCEFSMRDIELGCPLSTLAQEMAPIDKGFRDRLQAIYLDWYNAIVNLVKRAIEAGEIDENVDPDQLASLMIAAMEGCLTMAKVSQDLNKLNHCGGGLVFLLNRIRK